MSARPSMRGRDLAAFSWQMTRGYRATFVNMAISSSAVAVLEMALPYLFALVVDEVIHYRQIALVPYLGIAFLILFAAIQLLSACSSAAWGTLKVDFHHELKQRAFERIIRTEASVLDDIKTGDLITTINSNVTGFSNLALYTLRTVVNSALQFAIAVAVVATIDLLAAAVLAASGVATLIAGAAGGARSREHRLLHRSVYGDYVALLLEFVNARAEVRRLGSRATAVRWVLRKHNVALRALFRALRVDLLAERTVEMVALAATLVLYGLTAALAAAESMTLGTFLALVEYFVIGRLAIARMGWGHVQLQHDVAGIIRVHTAWQRPAEAAGPTIAPAAARRSAPDAGSDRDPDGITLHDVRFRYQPDGPEVLRGVSLRAARGERLALVGRSGAGKTSLIQLLLRLYRPTGGRLFVGGRDVRAFPLAELRRVVGVAYQNPLLFADTVRANLIPPWYGGGDTPVTSTCERVGLGDWLGSLRNGLDTQMADAAISRGERQRLAIARTILRRPDLLILDEATSGIDDARESAVYDAVFDDLRGRTVLIVSHRPSTVRRAERVAFLDAGEIVAVGTHRELLRGHAGYRSLMAGGGASGDGAPSARTAP